MQPRAVGRGHLKVSLGVKGSVRRLWEAIERGWTEVNS